MKSLPRILSLLLATLFGARIAAADETCLSPYMPKIVGPEDYVYVWTLGIEGLGDGSDKLVTIGANPKRQDFGKVISSVSIGAGTRPTTATSPTTGGSSGRRPRRTA